jgi:hypothetical protein
MFRSRSSFSLSLLTRVPDRSLFSLFFVVFCALYHCLVLPVCSAVAVLRFCSLQAIQQREKERTQNATKKKEQREQKTTKICEQREAQNASAIVLIMRTKF